MEVKKEILELCKMKIYNELGSLDDLPYELANTVANVYYRLFNFLLYANALLDSNIPGSKFIKEGDVKTTIKRTKSFFKDLAEYSTTGFI
ncbi:MAG TPA: hypothetical protein VI935_00950 [Thermodesulfobacteriota bacterium]|nr:hypothetical protein [Thermodesulfobacteriota bacterium]